MEDLIEGGYTALFFSIPFIRNLNLSPLSVVDIVLFLKFCGPQNISGASQQKSVQRHRKAKEKGT